MQAIVKYLLGYLTFHLNLKSLACLGFLLFN